MQEGVYFYFIGGSLKSPVNVGEGGVGEGGVMKDTFPEAAAIS